MYAEDFRGMVEVGWIVGLAAPAIPEPDPAPQRLGVFRIERELPHVGMGRIYEAVQEPLGRRVAVKTIREGGRRASPEAEAKFLNEQRALARLHHTHVVPIFAAGRDGDLQYFAMPHIDGASLSRLVQTASSLASSGSSGPTPSLAELAQITRDRADAQGVCPEKAESTPPGPVRAATAAATHSRRYLRSVASVLATAAEALQHAHEAHVIHRDVKPSNLMIDGAEHCWVIDFGLASLRNEARGVADAEAVHATPDALTHGGAGTPPYMAPEQFDRDGTVDARADVWGLGVTLYEMLAWRPAFSGRSVAELREKIRGEEPIPLGSHVRNVPRDLALICRKAMQKDPARRYPSAGEFAADLRHWLAGRPTSVRHSWPRRASLWARRNPGWAAVVLLLLAAGWGAVAAAAIERDRARAAERVGRLHELQGLRLATHAAGWSEVAQANVRALAAETSGFDPLLNIEAFGCLFGVDAAVACEFKEFTCRSVAVGPGGEVLMGGVTDAPTNRERLNARLWDGRSPQAVELCGAGLGPVGFRGDGTPIQLVADPERRTLTLMDLKQPRAIHEFEIPGTLEVPDPRGEASMPVAMTPDGSVVGARIRRQDGTPALMLWSGTSGRSLQILPGEFDAVALAPDGSLVAAGDSHGDVRVWDVESGASVAQIALAEARITTLAFGRNPRTSHDHGDPPTPRRRWQLAAGDAGSTIGAWDLGPAAPRQRLRRSNDLAYEVLGLAFSPDGTWLASGSRYAIHLTDVAGGEALIRIPTGDYPVAFALAPDGRRLVVGSVASTPTPDRNSVRVVDLEFGRGVRSLHGFATRPDRAFVSAGGRLVFAISQSFEIGVWDRATGQALGIFQAPDGRFSDNAGVAVSPDERRIAFASHRTACLWDIGTGEVLRTWSGLPIGYCDKLAWPEEGRLILIRAETTDPETPPYVGGWGPTQPARVCALYNLLGPDPTTPMRAIRDFNVAITSTALTPDGKVAILDGIEGSSREDSRRWVAAIDLASGRIVWRHRSAGRWGSPSNMLLDPRGRLMVGLVVGRTDGPNPLLEVATGAIVEPVFSCYAMGVDADALVRPAEDGRSGIYLKGRRDPILLIHPDRLPMQAVGAFGVDGRSFVGMGGGASTALFLGDLAEIRRRLSRLGLGW
ncbi:MAG: serine/threonine-protein kinase [Isosphaeraceae bacterium]|nr:serine/threonine-protein kinase [Isosphaeraceae bacterium]